MPKLKTKNRDRGNLFRMNNSNHNNNTLIYGAIALLALLFGVGVFTLLNNYFQTETYYTLKENVGAKTQINASMLDATTASKGTSPKAAKNIGDVQGGYLYSKYPLLAGDILTNSNTGPYEDVSTGIPDEWVVTSFSVPSSNAVNGSIKRGMYFDMMVADKDGATYPFVNMLALDSSNSSSSSDSSSSNSNASGSVSYTVGLTPGNAAKLQSIMSGDGSNIKLVLSPRQNEYAPPKIASYNGVFKYNSSDAPENVGKGTDESFTPVKRDSFGRPVGDNTNCSAGNAKLSDEVCKNNN